MTIPTIEAIRSRLAPLNRPELDALAKKTGVPFSTLWKIRSGATTNPALDTARALWVVLARSRKGRPA